MASKKKLLQAAAGSGGANPGLDVDEVFSTYLYEGNGSTQTITNSIDLSTEGGMVWQKGRESAYDPQITDTERGVNVTLTPISGAGGAGRQCVSQFNTDGFLVGTEGDTNSSGEDYVAWTFRKAPKFFDVITWTGDGSGDRTISHNLGTTIGSAFVKHINGAGFQYGGNWQVYHRSLGTGQSNYLNLNTTDSEGTGSGICPVRNPTNTDFLLRGGGAGEMNVNGVNYVAYLFAHNDGDADFGPTGDQDIIKCDMYTGTGTAGLEIDLGFEPQFLIIKRVDSGGGWAMWDAMRGVRSTSLNDERIYANTSAAETTSGGDDIYFTPTGFGIGVTYAYMNASGERYVYIAIRRGPLNTPQSATEVFHNAFGNQGNGYAGSPELQGLSIGFAPDMAMGRRQSTSTFSLASTTFLNTRLTDRTYLQVSSTNAQSTSFGGFASFNKAQEDIAVGDIGGFNDSNFRGLYWIWKRAPGFFDVVSYKGNGSNNHAIKHNLGVAPEWMLFKNADTSQNWAAALLTDASGYYVQEFNNNYNSPTKSSYGSDWLAAQPTDTEFFVYNQQAVNQSGQGITAMLFASLDGISKCGQYTGTGGSQNIDCGFSSSARFVLIKRLSSASNWWVFDTTMGMPAGNDPSIELNTSGYETNYDHIDSYSSGFAVNANGYDFNSSGQTYFFYAVA